MRKLTLFAWLLVALPVMVGAQPVVRLGGHSFVPEQNLAGLAKSRGLVATVSNLGPATGNQHNALVQLAAIPTPSEVEQLARGGIILGDYLGGNAYWALVGTNTDAPRVARGSRLTSMIPVRPEWKLAEALQSGEIPSYARVGSSGAKVVVHFAANAHEGLVRQTLERLGLRNVRVDAYFRLAYAELPLAQMQAVAELPWVLAVNLGTPPLEATNSTGRILGRASVLNTPVELGGRGLLGKGIRIGIWDADVTKHADFGDRITQMEYERAEAHGTHVTGTILGAGVLDPNARGMAPESKAWTYNFGFQSNGLTEQEEMAQAREQFGITLTNNSYGYGLSSWCNFLDRLVYQASHYANDQLAVKLPNLTHVYAAGNDQSACPKQLLPKYGAKGYGTASNRAKNAILVGAVNEWGFLTVDGKGAFSNFGPQDDGRMFPTLCAKGEQVYSTLPGNTYTELDGTSMACPTVTGHAALIQERYAQLNSGAEMHSALLRALLANTADDAGRPGPDFQFGYGIMNAEQAVLALEERQYMMGTVSHGQVFTHKIAVPKGIEGLRVMVVWNDPPAAKASAWGDRTLVNDLDISVSASGKSYLPWVCNPRKGHVEDNAKRRVDNLNNIEQVTLTSSEIGGLNEVEVTVLGSEVGQGTQDFALTWCYDRKMPRVISPADGMLLTPGGKGSLAVEGIDTPFIVELSYDGGKSWKGLGMVQEWSPTVSFIVPVDAPVTGDALLRVKTSTGVFAKSEHPFTIAPQPRGLKLQKGACGIAGWKLSWDQVPTATYGYEVLMADANDGHFHSVGHTETPDGIELMLPEASLKGNTRPVLSVAVRLAGGKGYGKRSIGLSASYSATVAPKIDELPFYENFSVTPSRYVDVQPGDSVTMQYKSLDLEGVPAGTQTLALICRDSTQRELQDAEYFDKGKNGQHISRLTLCDVDLTGIEAQERILLHLRGWLEYQNPKDKTTSRLRVFGGADGTTLLTSLEGETEYKDGTDWYFPLNSGQRNKVVIEYAGKGAAGTLSDVLALVGVGVEQAALPKRVLLSLDAIPTDKANMGEEAFVLRVDNLCADELRDLAVKIYCRGKWVNTVRIPSVKGMSHMLQNVKVDVSTPERLGEWVPVRFECVPDPSEPTAIASVEHRVNSMGKVVPMPSSTLDYSNPSGPAPLDPYMTMIVREPFIFTDNGGLLGNYSENQEATLKLLPSEPGMKVRVRFLRFKSVYEHAGVGVLTQQVPSDLLIEGMFFREFLMGNIIGPNDAGKTFISEAGDGGITLKFQSEANSADEGWVAEVDMVPARNPLALTAVESTLRGADDEGTVPIRLTIRNSWDVRQDSVKVEIFTDDLIYKEVLDSLKPGVNEVTLKNGIRVSAATPVRIQVVISGNDTDASDNVKYAFLAYDRYCIPEDAPQQGDYNLHALEKVAAYNVERKLEPRQNGAVRYNLGNPLPIYQGEAENALTFSISNNALSGWSLAAWVDWNDDGEFGADERSAVELRAGFPTGVLKLSAKDYQPGVKRVRVMVGPTAELANPCQSPKTGDIQDFLLTLEPGQYGHHGDLVLARVDAGEHGVDLSDAQPIRITLKNLGNQPFVDKVKVRVTVDGGAPREEEIDYAAQPIAPYVGVAEYTLATTANLKDFGRHTVQVELLDNPVAENNTLSIDVYCVRPSGDARYALAFNSQSQGEGVQVNGVAAELNKPAVKAMTLEMLVRLDRSQYATLLHSRDKGMWVYTAQGLKNGIPDNALGIVIDKRKAVCTETGCLTPGVWHHVAISIDRIVRGRMWGSSCDVRVYVDGQECAIKKLSPRDGAPDFLGDFRKVPELSLCQQLKDTKFDGKLKLFRASNKALDLADIRSFNYVRKADGTLPEGYIAEFTFDEGPKSKLSLSGSQKADIITASYQRLDADNGGIWESIKGKLIRSLRFDGMTKFKKVGENEYTLLFDKTTPARVKGTITTYWPQVKLSYAGREITADTEYDFTNPVRLEAHAQLFGKDFSQTMVLTREDDKSGACDLTMLSLEASKNRGLKADVRASDISETIALKIPSGSGALENPEKVVLSYSLSDLARIQYRGQMHSGTTLEVDLREPILVGVISERDDTKSYEISLQQDQQIEWNLPKIDYVYGDAPVDAGAVASSGSPVHFTSTEGAVATVVNGKLHIGKPGHTTITATLPAKGMYGEAKPVEKSIAVTRRPVGVMVAQGSYRAGYPLELIYSYKQLVNAGDALRMPDPVQRGSLLVKNSDGQTVDASRGLAAGAYKVEVGPAGAYQTDCYEVTPEAGEFTVVQADLWRVALKVTSGGNLLEGAVVNLDSEARISSDRGLVEWFLPAGKRYTFTVGKPGFAYRTVVVDLDEGKVVEQEIELLVASIQLKYSVMADVHGVLNGAIEVQPVQQLAPGSDGQHVMAVANEGYRFVKWDDNSTDNPRVDRNVTASQEVKAIFEPQQYTLEYGVEMAGNGAGGTVEGNARQTVAFGASGTEVEAKPTAGSFFGGWSDGVRTAKRSDGARNLQVKAIFGKLATLPHANSFGGGSLGDGWYTISTGPDYNPWSVESLAQSNVAALEGYFAACNSEKFGSEGHTQSSLYSPVFTGIDALTQDLHVAMTYAFEESLQDANADGKEFALQMSVDGKEWKNLHSFEAGVELNNTSVTIQKKRFKGAHTMQLRWRYDAKWGHAAEVDNVLVQVKDWDDDAGDEVRVTCKANPLNAGTFVVDGTGDEASELNVAKGDALPDGIRAVPAEGYEFTGWSTGSADPVLRIAHELFRDEEYTANFRELAKPLVTFRSQPAEGGVCKVAGNAVASLEVNRGDMIEVAAVPQADYRFAYWVDNGSTQATRTVTVNTSRALIAAYEKVVLYEASFMVTDHAGKPLDGAKIKVAGQELTTVGGSAKTTASLQEGEYRYKVELDGYFTVEGVLKVGKFFRDAKVMMHKPVAVEFTVKDAEGAALAGASISIAGGPQDVDFTRQMETGVEGKASFTLPSGDYSYTVEMKGYLPVQEKLVVGDVAVPVAVTLQKPAPNRYTLTFMVTSRSRPLEGAKVTVGDRELFTDAEGIASFVLEEGEYSYQVTKEGYESKEDRVKLEGDDAEVKVLLAKKKRPKPTPDAVDGGLLAGVVVAPNPFSEALEVRGIPADCHIQVLDALGKVVYAKEASGDERTTLQLGHLPSGVYLLVLEQGAARRVLRLLKQ